jgi:hypothetical protein
MKKAKAAKPKPVNQLAPIKPEPEENCGTCHCWRDGRCRRFPPLQFQGEALGQHRVVTAATDWCGEWRHA